MVTVDLATLEWMYIGLFLIIVGGILILGYKIAPKEYRNYSLSIITLLILLIALMIAPVRFQFYLSLGIVIMILNIFFTTIVPRFFSAEYESILIDKEPQVWESFKKGPELKEEYL